MRTLNTSSTSKCRPADRITGSSQASKTRHLRNLFQSVRGAISAEAGTGATISAFSMSIENQAQVNIFVYCPYFMWCCVKVLDLS